MNLEWRRGLHVREESISAVLSGFFWESPNSLAGWLTGKPADSESAHGGSNPSPRNRGEC